MLDLSIYGALPAAEYMRYSTDNQTENSIAYQQTKIRKYAAENNIQIVASFQDEAASGTNTDREGFQALVAAAHRKQFRAVIIYDISRGSRDVGDWFTFRKAMMYLGIQVISASGQKLGDLTNSADFLTELITVGMGQVEVLGTRQKSIDGVAVKAKQGAFLGGVPPLGYDIINGQYVINPAEARIVRDVFRWYAAGKSYDYIIDHLDGALGKRGRPIGKNTLNGMLQNERYIGVYTWNKKKYKIMRKWAGGQLNPNVERIEGAIPRIIDDDTWEKVQARMKDNKRPGRNKARHRYLLTGLIHCEECGAAYVGHASTNKKGYTTRYYCCGNKYRTHTCGAKNINADEIETFVVQHLKEYLRTVDFTETAQVIADRINGAAPDLSAEKAELAQIDRQIANGVKAVLSGLVVPELEAELDRLRVRKSELSDIIARRSATHRKIDPAAIVAMFQASVGQWNDENLPEIIRAHVTKIDAHTDGSFTVYVGVHTTGCGGRTRTYDLRVMSGDILNLSNLKILV